MKRIDWTRRALFAAVTLTLFMGSAMAGSIINRANEGPAIEGYDTVVYHTKGQPQKGDAKYSTEWNGAKWQFGEGLSFSVEFMAVAGDLRSQAN